MTAVAILQPGYLPWCGYFEQMAVADLFVHMDDVPFTRKDWRSRNRIKLNGAPHWLSVPTKHKPLGAKIGEIEVDNSRGWSRKHRLTIENAYRTAPYFELIKKHILPIYEKEHQSLLNLDLEFIEAFRKLLLIDTPFEFSSNLKIEPENKSDRVLKICKSIGASLLYDGQAARDFLNLESFSKAGIEVVFQDYHHPVYGQGAGEFISHLSAIDIVAHVGPNAGKLIYNQAEIF